MQSLRAILVDDEINSLQNLQQKLTEFCPAIQIVVTAQQPEEAILFIHHYKPDVVFLDIDMPRMNGFKMIEEIEEVDFEIVFTTAYNHYAVDAIRISAFDYLVKPVSVKDLQRCVDRLTENRVRKTRERLDVLRQGLNDSLSQEDKIALPTSDGIDFIRIKEIIYIESDSQNSKVVLTDNKSLLVTKPLKDLEELLFKYHFYRVNIPYLINLLAIKRYVPGDGGEVVMQNGESLPVAKRKKEEFLKMIGS
jgi:two-component system, LytTR family, response regulator